MTQQQQTCCDHVQLSISVAAVAYLVLGHLPFARATAREGQPECYHPVSDEIWGSLQGCPSTCPYRNRCWTLGDSDDDDDTKYSIHCVAQDDCKYLLNAGRGRDNGDGTFDCIGDTQNELAGCKVIKEYAADSNDSPKCEKCEDGWDLLDDGTCQSTWSLAWMIVLPIFGAIILWAVIEWFWAQCCMPTSNAKALERGLRFRFRNKVRQMKEGYPLYPLWYHPIHTEPILGPDQALWLNWFVLVGLVALWLTVVALFYVPDVEVDGIHDLCAQIRHPKVGRRLWAAVRAGFAQPWVPQQELLHARLRRLQFADGGQSELTKYYHIISIPGAITWAALNYWGALLITVVFLIYQRRLQDKLLQDHCMMHYYAFEAHGFPRDATDHHELHAYVQEVVDKVMGVAQPRSIAEISICYDYSHVQAEIQTLIDAHLRKVESDYEAEREGADGWQPSDKEKKQLHRLSKSSSDDDDDEESLGETDRKPMRRRDNSNYSSRGGFTIQSLAYIMLGADLHLGCLHLSGYSMCGPVPDAESSRDLINSLSNSGTIVVVMQSEALVNGMLKAYKMPVKFRHEHIINIGKLREEPLSMKWEAYQRHSQFWRNLVWSLLILILALLLWTSLYLPWAFFSWEMVNDVSNAAFAINTVVGLVIALGNAALSCLVVFLSERVGFTHQSNMRMVQLFVVVPLVIINVVSDFMVTYFVAYKKFSDRLPSGSSELEYNFGSMLIQGEMWGLLVPGYVLLPYVAEPIATILLPFWIGVWRVKADKSLTPEDAERLLVSAEMDIVNPYLCDLIVITSTLCLTFIAPAHYHWMLWLSMFGFALIAYVAARYRMLRHNSTTYFSTCNLHMCESFLWGLPLGILGACWGSHFADSGDLGTAAWYGTAAFVIHCLLYFLLVRDIIPCLHQPRRSHTEKYSKAHHKVLATYRNTNPIEVLKSNLLRDPGAEAGDGKNSHVAPWLQEQLIHCQRGREHLQPGAFSDDDGDDVEYTEYYIGYAGGKDLQDEMRLNRMRKQKQQHAKNKERNHHPIPTDGVEPEVVGHRAVDMERREASSPHVAAARGVAVAPMAATTEGAPPGAAEAVQQERGSWTYVCACPDGVQVVRSIRGTLGTGMAGRLEAGQIVPVLERNTAGSKGSKVVWLKIANPAGFVPEVGCPELEDGSSPYSGSAQTRQMLRVEKEQEARLGKRFLVNPEYGELVPVHSGPGVAIRGDPAGGAKTSKTASVPVLDPGSMIKIFDRMRVFGDAGVAQSWIQVSDLDIEHEVKGWVVDQPASNGKGLLAGFKSPNRMEGTWAVLLKATTTAFSAGLGPERPDRHFVSKALPVGAFHEAYEKMVTTDLKDSTQHTWIRLRHLGWIAEASGGELAVELVKLEAANEVWICEEDRVEARVAPTRKKIVKIGDVLKQGQQVQVTQKATCSKGDLFLGCDSGWVPESMVPGGKASLVFVSAADVTDGDAEGHASHGKAKNGNKKVVKKRQTSKARRSGAVEGDSGSNEPAPEDAV